MSDGYAEAHEDYENGDPCQSDQLMFVRRRVRVRKRRNSVLEDPYMLAAPTDGLEEEEYERNDYERGADIRHDAEPVFGDQKRSGRLRLEPAPRISNDMEERRRREDRSGTFFLE